MQYRFFTIPVMEESGSAAEEMNAFIRGHRVLNVQREFVSNERLCGWCCCVEYIENGKVPENGRGASREKIDYRTVLNDRDFERFRLLRECRKILAEEDAVPAYAVFLDEQLALLARQDEINEKTLKSVPGIGEKKVEKYGKRFLELWEKKEHEAGGEPVSADSGN